MYYLCFNSVLFGDVSESVSKLLAGTRRCNDFIDHVIFLSVLMLGPIELMPGPVPVWARV